MAPSHLPEFTQSTGPITYSTGERSLVAYHYQTVLALNIQILIPSMMIVVSYTAIIVSILMDPISARSESHSR